MISPSRRSRRPRSRRLTLAVATGGALATILSTAVPATAATGPVVLASGLHNPRHLVVSDGAVYVAEAGRGAADPAHAPCIQAVNPETGQPESVCYGTTGRITRVSGHSVRTVVSGLPSVAGTTGESAGGVTDLTVPDDGRAVGVIGLGGDPRTKAASIPAPGVPSAGHLVNLNLRRGSFSIGTDVSAFEAANNPDAADPGSAFDSNPYSVARAGDGKVVVTDAGGNDLLSVDRRGRTSLLATFHARLVDAPPFLNAPPGTKLPMQAVPTSVTRGPDGAWYVTELTGFPFQAGSARVWRVVPGHAPQVVASGFTNIIDLAFDRQGRMLVLEIASRSILDPTSPGALWRIEKNGTKTLVTNALTAPGGVATGKDGVAYVTNFSTSANGGQLLAVRLP